VWLSHWDLTPSQGISSAPEEYQRRQNEALAGRDGVAVIAFCVMAVEQQLKML